jgi:hypothetical protein
MADDRERQDLNDLAYGGSAMNPPPRPPRRRKWLWIALGVFVLLPAVVMAAWTAIALNWSYSEGDRAGYVQKFSRKGWICKTWEGEIAMVNIPGAAQEKFPFTVRDDSVAAKLTSLMGDQVSIHYREHPGVPLSCFGETRYFVVDVKPVKAVK